MSLFLGFLCGVPILLGWYTGLLLVSRAVKPPRWFLVGAALLPLPFVGLALYGEVSYIVLEEGVVGDACDGNAEGILRRLRLGASANAKTDDGLSALDCAATNGHVEAARVLLEHGANPNATNVDVGGSFGAKTPREWATARKDSEMIRLFRRFSRKSKS